MVTELTISFNVQKFYFLPIQCITVFLWVPEQTKLFSLFSIQWILCSVFRSSRYMRAMKPTWCTSYLQFIRSLYLYTLHVSGLLVAHHQEVTIYIYIYATIGTCCTSQSTVDRPASIPIRPANGQLRRTTRTNCHMYTLLHPDEGLLASPKHVEV
jgi:hypothetical protein